MRPGRLSVLGKCRTGTKSIAAIYVDNFHFYCDEYTFRMLHRFLELFPASSQQYLARLILESNVTTIVVPHDFLSTLSVATCNALMAHTPLPFAQLATQSSLISLSASHLLHCFDLSVEFVPAFSHRFTATCSQSRHITQPFRTLLAANSLSAASTGRLMMAVYIPP